MALLDFLSDLGTGFFQAEAQEDALNAQLRAGQDARGFQQQALNTAVELQRPQVQVGQGALNILAGLFGIPGVEPTQFGGPGQVGAPDPNTFETSRRVSQGDVQQIFQQFLGRQATQADIDHYANTKLTPRQVAQEVASSAEGQSFASRPQPTQGATQGGVPPTTQVSLQQLLDDNPFINTVRQQGEQAIDRAAAARGLNASGGTLKDIVNFNQDVSSQGLQQFVLNPLFQLAGFGPPAATATQNATNVFGANAGNLALGAGNARASSFLNQANRRSDLLNSGINAFGSALRNPGFTRFLPTGIPAVM